MACSFEFDYSFFTPESESKATISTLIRHVMFFSANGVVGSVNDECMTKV